MPKTVFPTALFLVVVLASPVLASSSDWYEAEGGRVRLVTTGAPDESGVIAGVLQVDLKPGWKTYWRDPGDAGVPPTLDASGSDNVASVTVMWPAPERFPDGAGGNSIG